MAELWYYYITNTSEDPILIGKHAQFCQVRPVVEQVSIQPSSPPDIPDIPVVRSVESSSFMPSVTVDPSGILSKSQQESFRSINDKFSNVFSPGVGCYNGKSGPYEHVINMNSNLPPQRKGRVPMYNQKDLVSLQLKCDELLSEGILGRPEDCGVSVEYCHPSFLVKKIIWWFQTGNFLWEFCRVCQGHPKLTY